jgi:integrase
MRLTHFVIENAKRAEKQFKLSDGGGLYLVVQPSGTKLWRMKYSFLGKERSLSMGMYPAVSLAEARERRDQARKLLATGVDPSVQKKLDRIARETAARTTFALVAEEYVENLRLRGRAEITVAKNRWLLERLAAPIAGRPIAEITAAEVLDLLKRVERSGKRETARRMRSTISAVFRFAVATLRASSDPTYALRGALVPPNVKPRAAITDERQLGGLLRSIDEYHGWPTLKAALKFCALTFARPGEVRGARRSEFNFEKAVWRISAERTKMRRPHDIPLSRQALAVLREVWPMSAESELVFPSIISPKKWLSENSFNSVLRRMGYTQEEMTSHGFRSSASTILNERGFNPDVIEAALGHQSDNPVRRAYNRAIYWPERVALMQTWADMLDEFRRLEPATPLLAPPSASTADDKS